MACNFLHVGILDLIGLAGSFFLSSTSKEIWRFKEDAAGSGMTQEGSNRWIVFRLGTTEDFSPEGAKMMKLCAKAGLFGSLLAKYKSR